MIRRSIPLTVKCNTCKCPNYEGEKFVYEKEEFIDETGFHGVRLLFKCKFCLSDIKIKTEPNIGYVSESGAECRRKFFERCKGKLFRGAVQPETDGEEMRGKLILHSDIGQVRCMSSNTSHFVQKTNISHLSYKL